MAAVSAPFLQPSAQEDSMEISSPGNRHLDDIEIDFDEQHIATAVQDEHMGDGEEQAIAEYDEDMLQLEDGDAVNHNTEPTGPRLSTVPDEDLIDYSDDEEEHIAQSASPHATSPPVIEDNVNDSAAEATHESRHENIHDDIEHGTASQETELATDENEAANEQQPATEDLAQDNVTALNTTATLPEEDLLIPEGALKPRVSTTSLFTPNDGPGTPTDTGLHPIMMYYAEDAYPLFRARASSDGLLKDDNLVSVSLADMMKACRQALIMRTQQEIDMSLELLLTFDHLALSVVEDEPAAFQTSLQEVLDVYLQLQMNDGLEAHEVPPLDISCSLRVKFNNSIGILRSAADRGEGLSSVLPSQEELYYEGDQEAGEDDNEEQADGQYNEEAESIGQYVEASAELAVEGQHDSWQDDDARAAEHDEEQADPHADALSEQGSVTVPALSEGDSSHISQGPDDEDNGTSHEHNLESEVQDETAAGVSIVGEHDSAEDADGDEHYDEYEEEHVDDNDPDFSTKSLDEAEEDQDEENAGLHDTTDQDELNVAPGDNQIEQVDGIAAAPDASRDSPSPVHEYELDLEDYEAPLTTSPASKRQRETDDMDDESNSSKKLRPS